MTGKQTRNACCAGYKEIWNKKTAAFRLRIEPENSVLHPYCDCFYVGASKDRLAEIHSVYRRLSSNGLKCIFYIVGVSKEQQISEKGIIYNTYLDYDKIIKHIQHTRIILEVVQEKQQAPTLRLFESVSYNKILLTNNKALVQSPYYCDKIQFYTRAEDINMDVLRANNALTNYPNRDHLTPRKMLQFIANTCEKA